jgi:hypothetical protein
MMMTLAEARALSASGFFRARRSSSAILIRRLPIERRRLVRVTFLDESPIQKQKIPGYTWAAPASPNRDQIAEWEEIQKSALFSEIEEYSICVFPKAVLRRS